MVWAAAKGRGDPSVEGRRSRPGCQGPSQTSKVGGPAPARPWPAPQLTFIEAILVHVPVNVEVLPCREGQLGLRVLIGPVEGVVAGERKDSLKQVVCVEAEVAPCHSPPHRPGRRGHAWGSACPRTPAAYPAVTRAQIHKRKQQLTLQPSCTCHLAEREPYSLGF